MAGLIFDGFDELALRVNYQTAAAHLVRRRTWNGYNLLNPRTLGVCRA